MNRMPKAQRHKIANSVRNIFWVELIYWKNQVFPPRTVYPNRGVTRSQIPSEAHSRSNWYIGRINFFLHDIHRLDWFSLYTSIDTIIERLFEGAGFFSSCHATHHKLFGEGVLPPYHANPRKLFHRLDRLPLHCFFLYTWIRCVNRFSLSREQGFFLQATLIPGNSSTKSVYLYPPVIIQSHTRMMHIIRHLGGRENRFRTSTCPIIRRYKHSPNSALFKSVALELRHVLRIKISGPSIICRSNIASIRSFSSR